MSTQLPDEVLERMARAHCFGEPCRDCLQNDRCLKKDFRAESLLAMQTAWEASPGPELTEALRRANDVLTALIKPDMAVPAGHVYLQARAAETLACAMLLKVGSAEQ